MLSAALGGVVEVGGITGAGMILTCATWTNENLNRQSNVQCLSYINQYIALVVICILSLLTYID